MSKYTAEQVDACILCYKSGDLNYCRQGIVDLLTDYAAHLRERESDVPEGMAATKLKPPLPKSFLGTEDFCFCDSLVSLQGISGDGSPEGYLGSVRLKVNGKFVTYVRERESAKTGVTDEMIERAARAMCRKFDPPSSLDEMATCDKWRRFEDEARCCLEAVMPMLASARVPEGWQLFCTQCFASEESGSWEHTVHGDETRNHCTNCGGNNTGVHLPVNAINSIRQQASWIGKRYYPHEEDRELRDERTRLLALVRNFPGRSAKRVVPSQDWKVEQVLPRGRIVSTFVSSDDADGAMRKSNLPYITEDMLAAAPKPETEE